MAIEHFTIDSNLIQALLDFIKNNDYQLEERLPSERALAEALNVSRNSLREATKVLQTFGVLEIRRGSGMFLNKIDFQPGESVSMWIVHKKNQIHDMLSVREALELKAVELIPIDRFDEVCSQLQISLNKVDIEKCDIKEVRQHDREFHRIIRNNSGNGLLINICSDITEITFDDRSVLFATRERRAISLKQHEGIIMAFRNHDRDQLRRALRTHFESAQSFITNWNEP